MNPQNGQQNNQNGQNNKQQGLSWSAPAAKPVTPTVSATPVATKTSAPAKVETKPTSSAKSSSSNSVPKIIGWLAAGIVAGVIIAWGVTAGLKHNGPVATANQNATTTSAVTNDQAGQGSDASFTIASPQKAGTTVAIDNAVVSEPTWVVVYESRNGKPGNVLGAALFFPGHPQGTVELLRGTTAGQTYFVTKVVDNGDHKFSLKDDQPLTENGQQVWVTFNAN